MMIDTEKLWVPYSASGCTVEMFTSSVIRGAVKRGVEKDIAEIAVQTVWLEIADGKAFSTNLCSCGCGHTGAHSDVEHYALRKALELGAESQAAKNRVIEGSLNAAIVSHMHADNAAYLAENMPPEPEAIPDKPGAVKRAWDKIWSPYR